MSPESSVNKSMAFRVALLVAPLALLVWLITPDVPELRSEYRSSCKNNLKRIGLALFNYHESLDTFPPPYIADEDGRPMHSWRVLILPFLGHQDLYEQYDFNEPWNGPHNSQLADEIPDEFRCTDHERSWWRSDPTTDYLALVGTAAAFENGALIRTADITDGGDATVMIMELGSSDIHWMEPRDFEIRNGLPELLSMRHAGGTHALFADGSVRFVPSNIDPAMLEALVTIAGGEEVPRNRHSRVDLSPSRKNP